MVDASGQNGNCPGSTLSHSASTRIDVVGETIWFDIKAFAPDGDRNGARSHLMRAGKLGYKRLPFFGETHSYQTLPVVHPGRRGIASFDLTVGKNAFLRPPASSMSAIE